MRNMKESGIDWIGKIPENWKIGKVKDIFIRKNKKANDENPTVLSLARSGVRIRDISTGEGQLAESYKNYNPVEIGDLLLNPMDLYSGANCSVSKVKGVISPAYINLKAKGKNNSTYYDYFFKTQYWGMVLFAHGKGVSFDNRWTLGLDTALNYFIPIPSETEQDKIAVFLDKRIYEIDNVIEKMKETIEDYKRLKESIVLNAVTRGVNSSETLKESGNVWIRKIPNNWTMLKMNKICKIVTDYVASGSFASLAENVKYIDTPDYARLIRTMDISGKYENIQPVYINEHAYNFLSNSNLFGGEIILPNIGASVGDVYIVPNLYKKMSLAPNSIMIKTRFVDKYYYYCFLCNVGRQSLISISGSTAQPKFNKTDFKMLKFPVPPMNEQEEIVKYLDKKCIEIDSLIISKEKIIEELEQYKKSLIYEYVTGKKEVV